MRICCDIFIKHRKINIETGDAKIKKILVYLLLFSYDNHEYLCQSCNLCLWLGLNDVNIMKSVYEYVCLLAKYNNQNR